MNDFTTEAFREIVSVFKYTSKISVSCTIGCHLIAKQCYQMTSVLRFYLKLLIEIN